jgi:rod shape-determining protein MreD
VHAGAGRDRFAARSGTRTWQGSDVHWFGLVIVTIVVAAAQTSVGSLLTIHGVGPSFLLATAVWYGFRWPVWEAGIAGWSLGLAADLTSAGPIGAHSLSFAVAAMIASRSGSLLMTDRAVCQILVTGCVGWLAYSLIFVHGAWRDGWAAWSLGVSLERAAWVAAYTAVLSPYLFWLLARAVPLLSLQPHGRRR